MDDIYIPPTPAQERDALRAEVERWKAKYSDQAAIACAAWSRPESVSALSLLASADADRIRLIAEVERLRNEVDRLTAGRQDFRDTQARMQSERKGLLDEVKRLKEKCDDLAINGFQAKLKELERLRSLLRAAVTGDPEGQPRLVAWQKIHREFGEPRAAEAGGE